MLWQRRLLRIAAFLAILRGAACFVARPSRIAGRPSALKNYAIGEAATSVMLSSDLVESFRETFRQTLPLQGLLLAVAGRVVISELRYRIERPVMGKVAEQFKPTITKEAWAKFALCIFLDLVGDASEVVPIIGELSDLGWSGIDFFLLRLLFKSNWIAGFGFVEEILPFTDIIPTFTIAWCLQEVWPTTPLARALGVGKELPEELSEEKGAAAPAGPKPEEGPNGAELLRKFDEKAKRSWRP
eukprot:scaffold1178_cov252-Pinguiococcus_pyrenoidosus.AAC.19